MSKSIFRILLFAFFFPFYFVYYLVQYLLSLVDLWISPPICSRLDALPPFYYCVCGRWEKYLFPSCMAAQGRSDVFLEQIQCSPRRQSKQPKDHINLERECMHFVREASFWLATVVSISIPMVFYYRLSPSFCSPWIPQNTLQNPSHLSINLQP